MLTFLCELCQHIEEICYNNVMKTKYHHGNLKESLVETALKIVETKGLESLTLREITNRLGTSRSAIYRHFDSKEALMQEVILAAFERLDRVITPTLLKKEQDVMIRFHNMGNAYIDFAIQNPAIYRMIFGHELQQQREESCDINDETQATGFHALIALLKEGQESGLFKKDDPMIQATVVWSMIHGLANLFIDGHLHVKENLEVIFNAGTKTLFEGLKA
jgi:AcrR family transcriptional regulator